MWDTLQQFEIFRDFQTWLDQPATNETTLIVIVFGYVISSKLSSLHKAVTDGLEKPVKGLLRSPRGK
jgi:hypothetical protein